MSISITLLEAFGLYLVRTSALILGSPLLGSGTSFPGYKIALIVGVTVAIYMSTGAPLEHEAGAIEYALIAALVSIAAVGALQSVGTELVGVFDMIVYFLSGDPSF